MYIKYENIEKRICIDVRTTEEFNMMNVFNNNIPTLDVCQHSMITKYPLFAIYFVIKGFIENKNEIKKSLLYLSNNKRSPILVACSRGRLRSPLIYLYAKRLGIDAKVLKGGLRPHCVVEDIERYRKLKKSIISKKVFCTFFLCV